MFVKRVVVPLLLLGMVTACDEQPNPNFQNALDARAAAQAGDAYADLDNNDRRWGLRNYSNQEPSKRLGSAQKTAVGLQGSYSGLLDKLDADEKIRKKKALLEFCRPFFGAASKLATADSLTVAARSAEAKRVTDDLVQCRTRAADAQEQGDSDAAPTLKRFASVGMVLVGASTVAKGDRTFGEALWNKGAKAADDDMPGFQIKLDNFH